MSATPSHRDDLARLRRIEGQIKGVQKMIEEDRYCIDILTQLDAVSGAVRKVAEHILHRHLHSCVHDSLASGTPADRDRKIEEIVDLLGRFRKSG
jgi:CsoR family transcriptional regulator, copper-sensing transcriptional repressor